MTDKEFSIRVRKNKSHAVMARVERVDDGLRLLEVEPQQGPMPDVDHLVGALFPDAGAVRRAVLAAMDGVVGDTLDNVLFTRQAYEAVMAAMTRAGSALRQAGIPLDAIGTEMAKPLPSGELLVWVDVKGGPRVEVVIPKGEWAWRRRPN